MSSSIATSACWRERPLTGNFRGGRERPELAGLSHCARRSSFPVTSTESGGRRLRHGQTACLCTGYSVLRPLYFELRANCDARNFPVGSVRGWASRRPPELRAELPAQRRRPRPGDHSVEARQALARATAPSA
jgi:hypothetical protein